MSTRSSQQTSGLRVVDKNNSEPPRQLTSRYLAPKPLLILPSHRMSPLLKVHFISPAVNHIRGLVLELIIYHLFYLIALLVGERFAMFLFAVVGEFRDGRVVV